MTAVSEAFGRNFAERGELGAAVAVVRSDGTVETSLFGGVLDLESSRPWLESTPVLVWSATKGLASACLLHACQEAGISLDTAVSRFWPEFAAAGKCGVTVGQLLSHQAGLCAVSGPPVQMLDHQAVSSALAAQEPLWPVGEGHGYHARTFGFLLDELLRRIVGSGTLGSYWRVVFVEPMNLDAWIGMPEKDQDKAARIYAAKSRGSSESDPFYKELAVKGSLAQSAFATPAGLTGAAAMNTVAARSAEIPSLGGISTALGLATFYAMLAGDGTWRGRRYFQETTLRLMRQRMVNGPDKVLMSPTAFSAGFMMDPTRDGKKMRASLGSGIAAFGHPGAGGSVAFADPDRGIGFAFVMNQMELGVFPSEKVRCLIEAMESEEPTTL